MNPNQVFAQQMLFYIQATNNEVNKMRNYHDENKNAGVTMNEL